MSQKETLENILLSDNIEESILMNEDILFELIPELKFEKGFDQKNKYHCYDIWNHTINALKNSDNNLIIRITLLLHDIGKPFSCQEESGIRHFKGHATVSANISKLILERLNYSKEEIEEIYFYIKNHATTITENDINIDNIDKYKKLLHIQYCDCSAYAPEYANIISKKLDLIKKMF